MSLLDGLHPVTTEGQILLHIANTLDELNAKLQGPAPAEPDTVDEPADDKPEPAKAPAKKAASRRKVTGQ